MTAKTLPKVYKPDEVEERLYRQWLENNYFLARGSG